VSELFSTSQAAVAWGIRGWATVSLRYKWIGPPLTERPALAAM